jgi:condensin complex subunit 1
VRKEALKLLATLLEKNQIFPVLRVSSLRQRLDVVETRLAEAHRELSNPPAVPGPPDKENAGAGADGAGAAAADASNPNPESAPAAAEPPRAAPPAMTQEKVDALRHDVAELTRLKLAIRFAEALDRASNIMCKMMGSKNKTDVVEVVNFLMAAKNFQLEGAEQGFRKMLALLWSKEAAVKDAVVNAYRDAYLATTVLGHEVVSQRDSTFRIARSLISLAENATLSQLTSLELLMAEFAKAGLIEPSVINALWAIFASPATMASSSDVNALKESRGAIALLSMIATQNPDTVRDHLDKLAMVGLMDRARWAADPQFAKYVCIALQKMGAQSKYGVDHPIFEKLTALLNAWGGVASRWCQSAEHVINAVYALCSDPTALMEPVIRSMAASVLAPPSEGGISADGLARLLFLVGHVALKELLKVEAIKQSQLAQREAKRDDKQKKESPNKRGGAAAAQEDGLEKELGVDDQEAAAEEEEFNQVPTISLGWCAKTQPETSPLLGFGQTLLSRIFIHLFIYSNNQSFY